MNDKPLDIQDNKCHFIKDNGVRCNAYRLKDSLFCYLHSGGDMHQGKHQYDEKVIVKDPVCMKTFIATVMIDTLKKKVEPNRANAVFNGADKALKCIQLADIDSKLQAIMDRMNGGSGTVVTYEDMDCLEPSTIESKSLKEGNK